jgi:hypothetical protein
MADRHLQNADLVTEVAKHARLADDWSLPLLERLDTVG